MKGLTKYCLLFLLAVACEKPIDKPYNQVDSNLLVVEGLITNENRQHEVVLSKPVSDPNEGPKAVSGADVAIHAFFRKIPLTEDPTRPGVYMTDSTRFVSNTAYRLTIDLEGKTFSAEARMIPVITPDTLVYSVSATDSAWYQIDFVAESFLFYDASMYEVLLDWSHLPEFADEENTLVKTYYYTLPSIDVGQIFLPDKEPVTFPRGTRVRMKKYSLTADHAEFIRTMLIETEWRGGYFDTSPGNVYTNLSDGAVGYFGASSVKTMEFVAD